MKRPVIIWSTFALLAVAGCAVLGWFTAQVLRLERESAETRRLAAVEENVRLALWRLDSALAVIQGAEAARSPEEYQPFLPATGMPSPLLGHTPRFVRLHLEVFPDGTVRSPQVLSGSQRVQAIAAGIPPGDLDAAAARLDALLARIEPTAIGRNLAQVDLERKEGSGKRTFADEDVPAPAPAAPDLEKAAGASYAKSKTELFRREELLEQQTTLNIAEAERRRNTALAATSSSLRRDTVGRLADEAASAPAQAPLEAGRAGLAAADAIQAPVESAFAPEPAAAKPAAEVRQELDYAAPKDGTSFQPSSGLLEPLWLGGELFLAREATVAGEERIQAVWLDWQELSAWMAGRVADLLPNVTLVPQTSAPVSDAENNRRLAFLPVVLEPGFVPVAIEPGSPFLKWSLGAAWAGAAVALFAFGFLLHGAVRLSERRGAFVSAVTHELRTPLTTFRMYTEMLAGGMVPDEAKRRSYLETLRHEAERLSHLVENVLSYARLERGRAASRVETTTAAGLIEPMEQRLRQRAEQAGMQLRVDVPENVADVPIRTDLTAVEQIVFNLVDNAAKYARRADESGTITVSVARGDTGNRLAIRVADNGPGLSPDMKKRLFRPFSKSASEAAGSQPGVGLGLALCRRLARQELRGDLILERSDETGTVFRLEIRSV